MAMTNLHRRHSVALGVAALVLALAWALPANSSDTIVSPEGDKGRQTVDQSVVSTVLINASLNLSLLTYSGSDGDCLDLLATRLADDAPVFRMGGCGLNNDPALSLAAAQEKVRSGASPPLTIQGTHALDDNSTLAIAFGIAPAGASVHLALSDGSANMVTTPSSGYFIAWVLTDNADVLIGTLTVAGQPVQVE